MGAKKLLFVNLDGLTDALLLTAAIRDLQLNSMGAFEVDVYTKGMSIWNQNQHLTRLDWRAVPYDGESEVEANEYPLAEHKTKIICYDTEIQVVHCSRKGYFAASEDLKNINAYHRIHSLSHDIADKLGLSNVIPIGEQRGLITLSDVERSWISQVEEMGNLNTFWLVQTGGSELESAAWWHPSRYQRVVDDFRGKISFVQVGLASEAHPRLEGVIDLVGKTDLRQLIRLMHHAGGFLGAPGFLMDLAAATPVRPFDRQGRRRAPWRPAVIVAGGREPFQWYAYEGHQVLHTNGMLPCCETGGCGKTRCEQKHRFEPYPEQLCTITTKAERGLLIPKCLDMITPKVVSDRIRLYFEGGSCFYDDDKPRPTEPVTKEPKKEAPNARPEPIQMSVYD